MTSGDERRIRALRPAKLPPDPWRPVEVLLEEERVAPGASVASLAVFLAGSECPFTCSFCDLWRRTLEGPTPAGALPAQLDHALARLDPVPAGAQIKLYNASNFFDARAVPPTDWEAIAERLRPFARVTVECHPRLVGESAATFAGLLAGRLEVAMGLETIHPLALPRLNKRMSLGDWERAATYLAGRGIETRAFVLLGVPWVPPEEAVDWAVRSVAWALDRGARVVTIIPVRGGNGELERLAAEGGFAPPGVEQLEAALDRALALDRGIVLADLWDLDRLAACADCAPRRRLRLERINRSGRSEKRIDCRRCGGRATAGARAARTLS